MPARTGSPDITFGVLATDSGNTVSTLRDNILALAQAQLASAEASRDGVRADIASIADQVPELVFPSEGPPTPSLSADTGVEFTNPSLELSDFGSIRELSALLGARGAITTPDAVSIDAFAPSVTSLSIPEAPEATAPVTPPSKPAIADVDVPGAPSLVKPTLPDLDSITIPAFDAPTIVPFDGTAPEFQDSPVTAVLNWSNPQYTTEVMDEVLVVVRDMWAGGNGIPAAVEQAMWDRAAGREDLDTSRQVAEAFSEFSSRGFTAPPGMLAARTDAIREESAIKKQGLNRDIAIRMAEISVENVRFAVEQGIAAENVLFNIWNNMAERLFETAKIQLESQLAIYNARVALYSAGQQAYAVEAEVYRTQLQADLATIEVFKAELDGARLRGELNQQRVDTYTSQLAGLKADVDIYDAQVRAANGVADANRAIIDGYRADIQAFAESINADRNRYDAYRARVQGEVGKAGIVDAEARAYAAYVSGQSTVADINIKTMEADIARNLEVFREFEANLAAEKAAVEADAAAISARVSAYTADTQRVTAEAAVEESKNKVKIAAKEAEIRATIGIFDVEVRKYIADMEQVIQRVGLQIEALKASGQMGATLAAGAMAGVNLGANIGGQASVSASQSDTDSNSATYNYQGVSS